MIEFFLTIDSYQFFKSGKIFSTAVLFHILKNLQIQLLKKMFLLKTFFQRFLPLKILFLKLETVEL